ncbi:5-hydroxytryptamine receptor 3A-like, partial [Genypterus blacodes]|uniref:5-hydroxytryptamine receptor 3A-like n=1 Tax=Genypterus blacodes TaxID=154954 RepID=UPI003F757639
SLIMCFDVLAVGCVSSETVCSYQNVLEYLNLTKDNELYYMTRPVKDYKQITMVDLDINLYAILDVDEKEQRFTPYVWIEMSWTNQFISWDPDQFCGIRNFSIPAESMWQPDITIEEMTERDKAPLSPFLTISSNGLVKVLNDQVLVSTCRLNIHKFPFDIQKCTLSFKSLTHPGDQLQLQTTLNNSQATKESREVMRTQYEWLFLEMKVNTNDSEKIIYTIIMQRRPILYSANFLLPVFFFLCLDLFSFLISDTGGEKLSFKVTVLLAVTVLQLILNEILPSASDRVPLIAMYCIGIFALMLLSLLETIIVMYLIEKDREKTLDEDSEDKQDKSTFHNGDTVNKRTPCSCFFGVSSDDKSSELLSVEKEDSSSKEACDALVKLTDELHGLEKTLTLFRHSMREGRKPGKWTRLARKIDILFGIFYVGVIILFLSYLFKQWSAA